MPISSEKPRRQVHRLDSTRLCGKLSNDDDCMVDKRSNGASDAVIVTISSRNFGMQLFDTRSSLSHERQRQRRINGGRDSIRLISRIVTWRSVLQTSSLTGALSATVVRYRKNVTAVDSSSSGRQITGLASRKRQAATTDALTYATRRRRKFTRLTTVANFTSDLRLDADR